MNEMVTLLAFLYQVSLSLTNMHNCTYFMHKDFFLTINHIYLPFVEVYQHGFKNIFNF